MTKSSDPNAGVGGKLLVPAYFHPAVRPEQWAILARRTDVEMVILNIADGPGVRQDSARLAVVQQLHQAGIAIVGYVDVHYGQRARHEIVADIGCFMLWYQVSGIFFDRILGTADEIGAAARLAGHARDLGARVVVFHHGTYPAEGYAEHADILGTFEGPWSTYVELPVPRWTRTLRSNQFYHVIYAVPPVSFGAAALLAARRRAGYLYITDHDGPNPYHRLPTDWVDAAASL